jgi:Tfp pilus assembly protein PilF
MNALRQSKDPAPLAGFAESAPSSPLAPEALRALVSFSVRQKKGEDARRYFEAYMVRTPGDRAMMNNYAWICAGQGINLDHAAQVAARAVALAPNDGEKSMYLDTEAAAEFALDHRDRAIVLEEEALGLLKNASPKERKTYEEALARYKAPHAAQ